MSIKEIFIFSIFWKIIFLNYTEIYEIEKFGEISSSGENYYYLDAKDYEKGEEIYIELLFQDNYDFSLYKDINLLYTLSDYKNSTSFKDLYSQYPTIYSIVDKSANFYYIYTAWNKKKTYILLSTKSFSSELSAYTIRHINFSLYELPKYSEKTIKGEKYLFLNVNDYKLYEGFQLQVSFKSSLFNHD